MWYITSFDLRLEGLIKGTKNAVTEFIIGYIIFSFIPVLNFNLKS